MTATYRVYGMSQSFFTQKLLGALAYKRVPHRLVRFAGACPEARGAGWPGGIPVVRTPEGEWAWDTTELLHHLEGRFPEPALLPQDPVQRFLDAALEDFADEWLYRPAVGSRWHFEENARVGGFELARDATHEAPVGCDQAFALVRAHVSASCAPFGVTAANVQAWIDEVLRPWQRAAGAHLAAWPYFFGERPSLADFAAFGGCAAHFANDPLCRRWLDAEGRRWCSTCSGCGSPRSSASAPGPRPATCRTAWSRCSHSSAGTTCRGSAPRRRTGARRSRSALAPPSSWPRRLFS